MPQAVSVDRRELAYLMAEHRASFVAERWLTARAHGKVGLELDAELEHRRHDLKRAQAKLERAQRRV